ncbi:tellurite resistance TerB family protein [Tabrizicola sp. J26]|nr:tellurite resistance TerB family protein [Tabrizicola rongguiensis]
MRDVSKLMDQLLAGGGGDLLNKAKQSWGAQSTGTKGALAGGLLGVLLGGKGGLAGVARVGGAALIGSLASRAYADYQAGKSPMDAITGALGLDTAAPQVTDELNARLVRAMIAAAKADGNVTLDEQEKIKQQIQALGLGPEVAQLIQDELSQSLDIDRIAAMATSPEEAAQIYTASMLVVDPDTPAEKDYLALLAQKMNVDPGLAAQVRAQTDALFPKA